MYLPAMKPIILKAMSYTLIQIKTDKGYKGDDLLRLVMKHLDEAEAIRILVQSLGFEVKILHNPLEVVCVIPHPTDIYHLKD